MRILYIPKRRSLITSIKYGYLYNWYAATDSRNIAASGWHVPTSTELQTLINNVGFSNKYNIKETGTTYWNTANGTNVLNFNLRGSGSRTTVYGQLKLNARLGAFNEFDATRNRILVFSDNTTTFEINATLKNYGTSIRLIKDSTTLTNGQTGTYTGNDGKVYRTIAIGNPAQEWLADNLAETLYRNGDSIPVITDQTTWNGLTTGARCVYNNDESNM